MICDRAIGEFMAFIFEYPLMIKEADLDTYGHVNNATYLRLYEEARWDFCTKGGFGHKEIMERKIGPIILELKLKFKKELKNREHIMITSKFIEKLSSLRFRIHQEMTRSDGVAVSSLDLDLGLLNLKTRKLLRPTREWLNCLGVEEGEF